MSWSRGAAPTLSVVVPVYNVREYLQECFESLENQTLTDLEIVAVDDGSTDGSGEWLDARAAADSRIHVFHQKNRGLGAARNRAIRGSRGRYLTFLDPDDVLPHDAYERLVASLEASGSAFAVGGVERFEESVDDRWTPAWVEVAHAAPARGVTIGEAPATLFDIVACNRVVRRSVWDEVVGRFPEGLVYEDHIPVLRLYLRGGRFDVLEETTYWWRRRADGSSLGQHKHELQNMLDRVRVKTEGLTEVVRHGDGRVLTWYVARVLSVDLPPFVRTAAEAEASPEYVRSVTQITRRFVGLAERSPVVWSRVEPQQQVLAWLTASEQRDVLSDFVHALLDEGRNHLPAVVERGEVRLDLSGFGRDGGAVPRRLGVLGEDLTGLRLTVTRAELRESEVVLTVRARVRRIIDTPVDRLELALTTGTRRVPGRVTLLGQQPERAAGTFAEVSFDLSAVQGALASGRLGRLVGQAGIERMTRPVTEVETPRERWRRVLVPDELVARQGKGGFVLRRPPAPAPASAADVVGSERSRPSADDAGPTDTAPAADDEEQHG